MKGRTFELVTRCLRGGFLGGGGGGPGGFLSRGGGGLCRLGVFLFSSLFGGGGGPPGGPLIFSAGWARGGGGGGGGVLGGGGREERSTIASLRKVAASFGCRSIAWLVMADQIPTMGDEADVRDRVEAARLDIYSAWRLRLTCRSGSCTFKIRPKKSTRLLPNVADDEMSPIAVFGGVSAAARICAIRPEPCTVASVMLRGPTDSTILSAGFDGSILATLQSRGELMIQTVGAGWTVLATSEEAGKRFCQFGWAGQRMRRCAAQLRCHAIRNTIPPPMRPNPRNTQTSPLAASRFAELCLGSTVHRRMM